MQARIIKDSISKEGKRITTFELIYPRFIHAEMCRHRVFSRTVESSRAKPIYKNLLEVENNPVLPEFITENEPGMVGRKYITGEAKEEILDTLRRQAQNTVKMVTFLDEKYSIHKQVLNRYLEPFLNTKEVVTSTEWDNFFMLRLAFDAEPHIQKLASLMKEKLEKSKPNLLENNEWHLPYISEKEYQEYDVETLKKVSSARCARCSYKLFDGTTDVEKDKALYDKLLKGKHFSPMEHVACPDGKTDGKWNNSNKFGNFVGWCQFRKFIE